MSIYKHLNDVIDSDGEIRIGRSRHLESLVHVYLNRELIAESDPDCDTIEDALMDVDEKCGRYIEANW